MNPTSIAQDAASVSNTSGRIADLLPGQDNRLRHNAAHNGTLADVTAVVGDMDANNVCIFSRKEGRDTTHARRFSGHPSATAPRRRRDLGEL